MVRPLQPLLGAHEQLYGACASACGQQLKHAAIYMLLAWPASSLGVARRCCLPHVTRCCRCPTAADRLAGCLPVCCLRAAALTAVVEACKPGAKIVDLCDKGDSLLNE